MRSLQKSSIWAASAGTPNLIWTVRCERRPVGEYDRIRLNLDAKDYVVTASIAGSNELGAKSATQLPPATLYDFTREELGSNPVLKLPTSSFRYLHVKLSAGITARPG